MALINCRECGREVSCDATVCPHCGVKTPSKKRHDNKFIFRLILFALALAAIGYGYFAWTKSETKIEEIKAEKLGTASSEEIKEKIIDKSDKEIIVELLKQGKSVGEISKTTKIRRDEIRKIKKELKQNDSTQMEETEE